MRRAAPLALLLVCCASLVWAGSVGPTAPDGTKPQLDFPSELHRKNIGSPPPRFNGDPRSLGCCVFRSMHHAGLLQDIPAVVDMPEWMVKSGIQGGGTPDKVAALVPRIAKDRGIPAPDYIQVEGDDLEILKLACRTGRMPSVTYSRSCTGRYSGQRIAHMVNLVHADDKYFTVLDNNYIGEAQYEWHTEAEFRRAYSPGWSILFLESPPPPRPVPKRER